MGGKINFWNPINKNGPLDLFCRSRSNWQHGVKDWGKCVIAAWCRVINIQYDNPLAIEVTQIQCYSKYIKFYYYELCNVYFVLSKFNPHYSSRFIKTPSNDKNETHEVVRMLRALSVKHVAAHCNLNRTTIKHKFNQNAQWCCWRAKSMNTTEDRQTSTPR